MKDLAQLRELSDKELEQEVAALRQELYQTRALAAASKLDKPTTLRQLRKAIAQALTVRHERRRAAETAAS